MPGIIVSVPNELLSLFVFSGSIRSEPFPVKEAEPDTEGQRACGQSTECLESTKNQFEFKAERQ